MKKLFYSILMLATSMGFVACSNEEPLVDAPTEQTMTIGASIGESDTRTYLDENFKVRWSERDRIYLENTSGWTNGYGNFNLLADYAGKTYGKFTGSMFRFKHGDYDAYYGISSKSLSENHNYKPGDLSIAPMHAKVYISNSTQIPTCQFKNLCGLLKVKIKNDKGEKIDRIKISADQPLSGKFDIIDDAAVMKSSGTYKFIQYSIQGGLELTPDGTDVFIAMPAGSYTNVSIEMESTKGGISTKSLNGKTLSIERSKITPASFSVEFVNPEFDECVDLGLPSGKKWASCNLGAGVPWKEGRLYIWGEISEYDDNIDYWEKLTNPDTWEPYKYNRADGKTTLDLEDDVAYVKTEGKYKIPSPEDFTELRENCYWVFTEHYNDKEEETYGWIIYRAKSESDKGEMFYCEEDASPDYSLSDTHIFIPQPSSYEPIYGTSSNPCPWDDSWNVTVVYLDGGNYEEWNWWGRTEPIFIRPIAVE